ncbi:glycosyl hydrolase family 28 protein [Schleiferilactobacillus shenzhenensis]|uniref:Pgl n=1 Tax=Schleiferilactobacillus shenzhenensis LY-73 TaxID=1231336 RepID=U4TLV8_9LACO|nr:glycosyl hydrolase family 28 protein [Schleiferilactobacillus shenzhenensis]ERL64375.1 Pgl [Schleiferilactobacillus shenzhenensis LY-73]
MSTEHNVVLPQHLRIAPATLAATGVSLIWDHPHTEPAITQYRVVKTDGLLYAVRDTSQTHFTIAGLTPATSYTVTVEAWAGSTRVGTPAVVAFTTKAAGKVLDVTKAPYAADPTGKTLATAAVQQAITDCPAGGTVLIPEMTTIRTGALFLKSQMTLQVDGVLQGSTDPADYLAPSDYPGQVNADGLLLNRYEGWELPTYASLLNAGWLNQADRQAVNCRDLTICGEGTIAGGGAALGDAEKQLYADQEKYPLYVSDTMGGRRNRGRLIQLIQCHTVDIHGLTLVDPPAWTVHMIYCDTITSHDLTIYSPRIDNGDGWDPDSSRNLLIYGSTFNTGDDCIAVKSGKNPEGNTIGLPTSHLLAFDLKMQGGHGMIIGSEMSGGVEDVIVRDSQIQGTDYGFEIKANPDRGGYVRQVTLQDCVVDRVMIHSMPYNTDGVPAATLPAVSEITIRDTAVTGAEERVIQLVGFQRDGETAPVRKVVLENLTLGAASAGPKEIYLDYCDDVQIRRVVQTADGRTPQIIQNEGNVHGVTVK